MRRVKRPVSMTGLGASGLGSDLTFLASGHVSCDGCAHYDHQTWIGYALVAPMSVPIGDGGNPSPLGEGKVRVTWWSATLQAGSAYEERPQGASRVDPKIQETGSDRGGRDSSARPDPADRHGA